MQHAFTIVFVVERHGADRAPQNERPRHLGDASEAQVQIEPFPEHARKLVEQYAVGNTLTYDDVCLDWDVLGPAFGSTPQPATTSTRPTSATGTWSIKR
jgi:hypothetical protein